MPNLITLRSRFVKPKGLSINQTIDENKIKEFFFTGDYEKLEVLDKIKKGEDIKLKKDKPTLLYPGSGTDILTPLIYIEKLFPEIEEFKFILVDTINHISQIKTTLDDVGVCFEELSEDQIMFYWKNQLINLTQITANVFQKIDTIETFDIYFEKAFRIMKDQCLDFEDIVVSKLNSEGFIISDSGFLGKYPQQNLTYFEIPKELSSYHEMVLAQKSSKIDNNSRN